MKTKNKYITILSVVFALSIVAAGVMALTNPEINNFNIGAGGESTGGGYTLTGSIGQHDAGVTLSGGEFTLAGGFWGAIDGRNYKVYIPLVLR